MAPTHEASQVTSGVVSTQPAIATAKIVKYKLEIMIPRLGSSVNQTGATRSQESISGKSIRGVAVCREREIWSSRIHPLIGSGPDLPRISDTISQHRPDLEF